MHILEFRPPPQGPPTKKCKRQGNVIWFNPPYNKNVKTSTGRAFSSLINRSFPADHKLRKVFNRHPKTQLWLHAHCQAIDRWPLQSHIEKRRNSTATARRRKKCNCRKKEECAPDGKCLVNEVVYQATIVPALGGIFLVNPVIYT